MTDSITAASSTMQNTMQIEDAHTSGVYPKRPLTIVRGEGAVLYDEAGNRYIDCVGGQGAANLGHSHPAVVATMRGFHGRTMGALSATWEPKYREPFQPLVPEYKHIPYNDLAAADAAITDQTAAFIVEVVQGEGGVRPGTGEYLQGVQKLCQERGAMFVVDEVQTGFGRTGKMFGHQHYDLQPDLMPVAKSIAG